MKKLLNGFTLAEILITLAIIGVVAALTMPSLIQNVERQKVGPALAKAINTLENANAMIIKNDVRSLNDACNSARDNAYLSCLAPYVNGVAVSDASGLAGITGMAYTPTTSVGSGTVNWGTGSFSDFGKNETDIWKDETNQAAQEVKVILNTKDGISYIPSGGTHSVSSAPQKYYGSYYDIIIDINGSEAEPNEVGIDRFEVLVDFYGSVIPYGGREYMAYTGGSNVLWETGCYDTSENPSNAASCAGSIVDNGYKVVYDY